MLKTSSLIWLELFLWWENPNFLYSLPILESEVFKGLLANVIILDEFNESGLLSGRLGRTNYFDELVKLFELF